MLKHLLITAIFIHPALSQNIPQKFFDALVYDKPDITDYINKDELAFSKRLGIEYDSVANKVLIGYEIPDEIKQGIRSGKYKYELNEQPLADTYTELTFSVPDAKYIRKYYFNNGFITNSTFHTWLWEKKESKYFTYRIEEPKYFNDYCIARLDQFVDMISDTLGFTITEKRILEKEKIGYIFCKDEESVEKITGFKAKGMAMLGSDEVVTSYQTHFHEVAHILINYKLKKLGLYTLPFFMEGFAVAVGGRGGMAPRVVTDLGYYLEKTGELTYDSIFTFDQFKNIDGSMSYPIAGLYNSFLLSELGGEKYLELYRKVNGDLSNVQKIKREDLKLPENYKWDSFLQFYEKHPDYYFDDKDTIQSRTIGQDFGYFPVSKNESWTKYFVDDYFFLQYDNLPHKHKYCSKLLLTKFPDDSVEAINPEEYGIFVDSASLTVINFFNDEVVIKFDKNFSINNVSIPLKNKYFEFFLNEMTLNKFHSKNLAYIGVRLRTYINKYLNK